MTRITRHETDRHARRLLEIRDALARLGIGHAAAQVGEAYEYLGHLATYAENLECDLDRAANGATTPASAEAPIDR